MAFEQSRFTCKPNIKNRFWVQHSLDEWEARVNDKMAASFAAAFPEYQHVRDDYDDATHPVEDEVEERRYRGGLALFQSVIEGALAVLVGAEGRDGEQVLGRIDEAKQRTEPAVVALEYRVRGESSTTGRRSDAKHVPWRPASAQLLVREDSRKCEQRDCGW